MERLDLDRPRDAGAIISTAFSTWWSHLGIFVALAAIPVFPVFFLIDGLWGEQLSDPDTVKVAPMIVSAVVQALIVSPLVTAMHVLVVLGLSRGEHPSLGAAVRDGVRVLPFVIAAVVLYALAVMLGTLLLIIPGIFLGVALYFAAQTAVVEDKRGLDTLKRSRELVKDHWWRTLGILILLSLLSALLALPLGFVTQIIGSSADNGPLYVLGGAIAQTITLSFTALAGTILFFDLRSRKSHAPAAAWQPPGGGPPTDPGLASPERPI